MNQGIKYKITTIEQKVRVDSKDAAHFAGDLLMDLSQVAPIKPGMTGEQFASVNRELSVRSQMGRSR